MEQQPEYAFGAASDLYRNSAHPRLLVDDKQLRKIRKRTSSGLASKLANDLRRRVKPLVDRIYSATNLTDMISTWCDTWTEAGTTVIWGLEDIAFIARLDNDDRAFEAVVRVLQVCPQADVTKEQPRKFLGLGAGSHLSRAYDLIHPVMADADRQVFSEWANDRIVKAALNVLGPNHERHAGGNIAIYMLLNGLTTALALDDSTGANQRAIQQMIRFYEASLYSAIGQDGYPEEDIGYGTSTTATLFNTGIMLRRAGLYDPFTACPRITQFGKAILHFVQPWGLNLSNTGDHGDDFGSRAFVLAKLAELTRSPELIWLLRTLSYDGSNIAPANAKPKFFIETPVGKDQSIPVSSMALLVEPLLKTSKAPGRHTPTAFRDRTRGIVSFRSGWDKDATFVVFDGCQRHSAAQGHAHASGGHFSLSALGEYFSIDTGRYSLEQSCHSVVLVNGKSGRTTNREWRAVPQAAVLTDYEPGPIVDTASVDTSLQHNCYWARRHLFLIKGQKIRPYVIVIDDLNAHNDWSQYVWQMQVAPENQIRLKKNAAAIKGIRHGSWLDVRFVLPAASEYPKPHQLKLSQDIGVPSSLDYIGDPAEKAAIFPRPRMMIHGPAFQRPRLLAQVEGYNGRFLSVMIPRRKGEKPTKVETLTPPHGVLALRTTFADVTDTFIFSFENHLLEVDDIVGRGRWCLIRRNRNRRVIAHAAGDTDWLKVAGRELKLSKGT